MGEERLHRAHGGEGGAKQPTLTVLHLWNSPFNTFSASITIRPAMTALVVAMAGMMFPAMAIKVAV